MEEVVDENGEGRQDPKLITIKTGGLCRLRMNSVHIYLAWKGELFYR